MMALASLAPMLHVCFEVPTGPFGCFPYRIMFSIIVFTVFDVIAEEGLFEYIRN